MKKEKTYNPKLRQELLTLAKKYTNANLDFMDKNSTISHAHCVKYIYHNCITNDTIRRIFFEKSNNLKNIGNDKVEM